MSTKVFLTAIAIAFSGGALSASGQTVAEHFEYPRILTPDGVSQNLAVVTQRMSACDVLQLPAEAREFVRPIASIESPSLRREARRWAIAYASRWDAIRCYLILYNLGLALPNEDWHAFLIDLHVVLVDIVANEQQRYGYRPEGSTQPDLDPANFAPIAMAMVNAATERPESVDARDGLLDDLVNVYARNVPVESALSRTLLGGIAEPEQRQLAANNEVYWHADGVDPFTALIGQWTPAEERSLTNETLRRICDLQNQSSRDLAQERAIANLQRRVGRIEDDLQLLHERVEQGFEQIRQDMRSIHDELKQLRLLPVELSSLATLRPPDDPFQWTAFGDLQSETQLLRAYAPILLFDRAKHAVPYDLLEVPVWPSWFKEHPPGDARRFGPLKDKYQSAAAGIAAGDGAFGLAQPLGESLISLQYYVFFAFNNARVASDPRPWVNRTYHHEGDWICIEVIIPRCSDAAARPPVLALYYHNHGAVVAVDPLKNPRIRFSDRHVIAYAEAGTNEPQPLPGDDGDRHLGEPGIVEVRGAEGRNYAVRPHGGTASNARPELTMRLENSLVNLKDPSSEEALLVVSSPGPWGSSPDSPKSPYFNPRMRRRVFNP